MKVRSLLLLAAAASLAAALVFKAPASLLARPIAAMTGNRLQLADLQGTAWKGSARLVCRLTDGNAECGRLVWRLDLSQSGRGMPALEINSAAPGEGARLAFSPRGWLLQRVDLTLPAALLGAADEKVAALGLGGLLRIEGRDVTSGNGALAVFWTMASTRLVPNALLGEHRLDVVLTSDGKNMVVSSQKGPLTLAGAGKLQNDGILHLDVMVKAPPADTRFSPLLSLLGKATEPGTYQLKLPLQ